MRNKKAFRLLLFARGVSGVAQGISLLAVPWYFTVILKQASLFGLVNVATNIVMLIWGIYVGSLADKYKRKNLLLALCGAGMIVMGSVSSFGFAGNAINAFILGIICVYNAFYFPLHYSALYSLGQEMSEEKDYGSVNSYIEITRQIGALLSGIVAAFVISGVNTQSYIYKIIPIHIEAWSINEIFLIDGITYLLAFILISLMKYEPFVEKIEEKGNAWRRIKTGVSFLKERPAILIFGLCSNAVYFIIVVEEVLLLPIYTGHYLKAFGSIYSFAYASFAVGAIFSGFLVKGFPKLLNNVKGLIIFMLIAVISYILAAFTHSVLLFLIINLFFGITNSGARITRTTFLFRKIPNYIIGRCNSVFDFISGVFKTFILLLFSLPFFSRSSYIVWAYFICGGIIFACIVPLVVKYRKILEHPYLEGS